MLHELDGHPIVGEVRGIGLLGGIELAKNKDTREPFGAAEGVGGKIAAEALKRGVIVRSLASVIMLAPPLIISEGDLRHVVDVLKESIDAVARTL